MTRTLTLDDYVLAGVFLAGGLLAGFLLRMLMRWLGRHATKTRWGGDDVIVDALRTLVPWAAIAGGAAASAAVLPLTRTVQRHVNQSLTVLLILVATITAARVIAGLVRTVTQSRAGVAGSVTIFVNITRVAVLAIGCLIILQTLGIPIAPLVTALGVGGLAVALALQDTLANLFAGIHILASKTVQPGDYIKLSSGEEGYVVDINWRQTTIKSLSNNLVIIPNGQLAGTNMTNFNQPEQDMTLLVQVGVGYDSDLEHVERVTNEVIAETMKEVEGAVPDHEPAVRFHTFGDSRIGMTVILGVGEFSDQYRIKHEFIKRLHKRYRAEGISVPVPRRAITVQPGGLVEIPHQREASVEVAP
ncbi:Transporter, small conductance mechanosensitive ion channel MscS family protein [Streptomyces graminofaciens]|uniref:Transporter, small conductance mechanosensitive ion channel MscS family protein n=1 Tax=Streptomyces graminofaciens TaxID=68212 RepID=A0ABN5VDV0_9ACTN|nr:mechanosensitive ion channel family protein [Streptomyces graminofaciens]BBC31224.1 Transporter, small conductance mechanosensitive ion channel MscS family protein [Streptomyces graminofaciens]